MSAFLVCLHICKIAMRVIPEQHEQCLQNMQSVTGLFDAAGTSLLCSADKNQICISLTQRLSLLQDEEFSLPALKLHIIH